MRFFLSFFLFCYLHSFFISNLNLFLSLSLSVAIRPLLPLHPHRPNLSLSLLLLLSLHPLHPTARQRWASLSFFSPLIFFDLDSNFECIYWPQTLLVHLSLYISLSLSLLTATGQFESLRKSGTQRFKDFMKGAGENATLSCVRLSVRVHVHVCVCKCACARFLHGCLLYFSLLRSPSLFFSSFCQCSWSQSLLFLSVFVLTNHYHSSHSPSLHPSQRKRREIHFRVSRFCPSNASPDMFSSWTRWDILFSSLSLSLSFTNSHMALSQSYF